MFFVFLHLKSGDMPSAHIGTAQRIARTIVRLEVAVAHGGGRLSEYEGVVVLLRLCTPLNPSFCLLARAWYSDQKTNSHCS